MQGCPGHNAQAGTNLETPVSKVSAVGPRQPHIGQGNVVCASGDAAASHDVHSQNVAKKVCGSNAPFLSELNASIIFFSVFIVVFDENEIHLAHHNA